MNENLERILIDEKTLKARIAEMGAQISRDYAGEELVVIGLLKGAAYFLTELTQHITVPVRIDFIKASSYGSGNHRLPARWTSIMILPGTSPGKTSCWWTM